MDSKDIVLFQIADKHYGMGIRLVQGVETYVRIVEIPSINECIEGLVDIRGEVVPIYNLRKKFQLDEVPITEDTKFLVVKIDGHTVGFKVDSVVGMRSIRKEDIFEVPPMVADGGTAYIDFIIKWEGSLAIVIKPDLLLDKEDKGSVKDVVEQFGSLMGMF